MTVLDSVAFSAAVDVEQTISTGDQLVFSDVLINEGGAYSSASGEFTAPRDGLYVFHVVLEIGRGGKLYVDIDIMLFTFRISILKNADYFFP